jgi:hypothetical protein
MSLGFPNLEYATNSHKFQTPVELPPLNQEHKTCERLNKEWKGELKSVWHNCVTSKRLKKNPEWKDLSDDDKRTKINGVCCEEVLQCNNPNQWLNNEGIKSNGQTITCPNLGKPSPFPHFGDIRPQASVQNIWWGIK